MKNKTNEFGLRLVHWNCFKLTEMRLIELQTFLIENNPDIISINETKLSEEKANLSLRFDHYIPYHRCRKNNAVFGGGVAILINDTITHMLISDLDVNDIEVLALKIDHFDYSFNFVSYYSSPKELINFNLFGKLLNMENDLY
jgi:exonuclease III